jgi:hypothetical protein
MRAVALLMVALLPAQALAQPFFDVRPQQPPVTIQNPDEAEAENPTHLTPFSPPVLSRQVEDLGPFTGTFRLIRKRLNRVEEITLTRDEAFDVDGKLSVTTAACIPNHGGVSGNFAAYVSVRNAAGGHVFNGWLFSIFPGLTSIQDERYDLLLVRCKFD